MGDSDIANPFSSQRELFSTDSKKRRSPAPSATPVTIFSREPRTPVTEPAENGWPSTLLEETQNMTQYISSVEGLQGSAQFQQHVRQKNNPFYIESVQGKLETYRVLRRIDPLGFRKLWSRTDIREYDTVEAATWLLLLEYVLSLCTSVSVLLWALQQHEQVYIRWLPVAAWVLLQVRAWAQGHTSAYGSLFGLYLVRDKVDKGAQGQQQVAGLMSTTTAQMVEFFYLFATFGLGVLTSMVMMTFFPLRSPVGQRLVGVHPVREVSHPVQHARFQPLSASYPTRRATSSKTKAGPVTPH